MGRFLVVGYGSIGQRHARILRGMGHDVKTVDPAPVGADFANLEVLPAGLSFDGVLICTPPNVRQFERLPEAGRYFVEKPLGAWTLPCQVGFCYRFAPSLAKFVQIVKGQEEVYSAQIIGGQHIQEWHREDFQSVKHRYHGVITDSLPHSFYIARWMLGELDVVGAVAWDGWGPINVEWCAGVLLRSDTNAPCYCLADYVRSPRAFWVEAVTSAGQIALAGGWLRWDFKQAEVDAMYYNQMVAFVEGRPAPTLEDGQAVERMLEDVRHLSRIHGPKD